MTVIAYTFTNDGHNLLRDGGKGANNPKVTYFALGSSNVAPTVNDHTLGAETFRKAVTSYVNGAAAGEVIYNEYVSPSDAVALDVEEVGWFGGNSATSAANSGVLLARGLYVHNPKTNLESIQVTLDLTI